MFGYRASQEVIFASDLGGPIPKPNLASMKNPAHRERGDKRQARFGCVCVGSMLSRTDCSPSHCSELPFGCIWRPHKKTSGSPPEMPVYELHDEERASLLQRYEHIETEPSHCLRGQAEMVSALPQRRWSPLRSAHVRR